MSKTAMLLLAALGAAAPAVADSGWETILDGHDLNGWQQVGPGKFVLEDGLLKLNIFLAKSPWRA